MRARVEALASTSPRPPVLPVATRPASPSGSSGDFELLRQTVAELRSQVKQQQQEMDDLSAGLRRIEAEFQDLKRSLGG